MAKKNSTKTATKEAIQNAVPNIVTFTKWQGINIEDTPMDSDSEIKVSKEWYKHGKSDDAPNFLALQNNVDTAYNGTLSTRYEAQDLKDVPDKHLLTGVAINFNEYIYAAMRNITDNVEVLKRFKLPNGEWEDIPMTDHNDVGYKKTTIIRSCMVFQSKLIVLVETSWTDSDGVHHTRGEMYDGEMDALTTKGIENAKHISKPVNKPTHQLHNVTEVSSGGVARLSFVYVYTNKYGSTEASPPDTFQVDVSPLEYSSARYITINGEAPKGQGITGVDIYFTMDESQSYVFCGHTSLEKDQVAWSFPWLGALMDTSEWTQSSLVLPKQNTTDGVDACYMDQYDGRIYFYGGSVKYRVYVGGNPGSELSVSTGLGGAFIDIEPGSGQEIRKVLKFRTYNGATVVTLLTYHHNTNQSSRYNLLETEITVTNEYASKGYTYERVDNVIGVSSYYGADTFIDGLYAVNRYGLAFTTQAQEHQDVLRVMYASEAIKPLFESLKGYQINNSRLLCVKDTIYIVLAKEGYNAANNSVLLENYVLCYDTTTKAWYTYRIFDHDEGQFILHMIQVDSSQLTEGVGIITPKKIVLLPTTGNDFENYYSHDGYPNPGYPNVDNYIETHELAIRTPITNVFYCCQLEVNFDYMCAPHKQGGVDLWIEGYDVYGRHFKIIKKIYEDKLERLSTYYIRVDRNVKSFRLFLRGKAHFRLTHINMKYFKQSNSLGVAWGFDSFHQQKKQHGRENLKHHAIKSYNDLKEILIT